MESVPKILGMLKCENKEDSNKIVISFKLETDPSILESKVI